MKEKGKISISMMCVGITQTEAYLKTFEDSKIEYLHIDVMDGSFVPNFTLGPDYVRELRKLTKIPFDFHFMVESPEEKMPWFDIAAGDYVSVHYESTNHINKCLQYIREQGAHPMVAISPGTPLCVLEECLEYIDGVLVMTVNPGFAGQKIVKSTIKKVEKLRKQLDETGYKAIIIETDGNMSVENASLLYNAGASMFVAGTSSIIKESAEGASKRIEEKRKVIGW